MKMEELRKIAGVKIGEAVGYASLCWNPKPTGVFDTNEAQKCCDELMKYVDTLLDVAEAARVFARDHIDMVDAIKKLEEIK